MNLSTASESGALQAQLTKAPPVQTVVRAETEGKMRMEILVAAAAVSDDTVATVGVAFMFTYGKLFVDGTGLGSSLSRLPGAQQRRHGNL